MISLAIKAPAPFLYPSGVYSIKPVLSLWYLSDHLKEEFYSGDLDNQKENSKCAGGMEESLGTQQGNLHTR